LALFKSKANTCAEDLAGLAEKIESTAEKWGDDYVIATSITAFSTFYFANNSETSLPLNLVSFTANTLENRTYLEWKTTDQINFSHFELERSLDGRVFKHILTVPAHNQGYYTAMDEEKLWAENAYYRLKMVDFDNTFGYSKIISVELSDQQVLTIYPNPASTVLNLKTNGNIPSPEKWEIVTAEGILVSNGEWNDQSKTMSVQMFPPGVYILTLYGGNMYQRIRFAKE